MPTYSTEHDLHMQMISYCCQFGHSRQGCNQNCCICRGKTALFTFSSISGSYGICAVPNNLVIGECVLSIDWASVMMGVTSPHCGCLHPLLIPFPKLASHLPPPLKGQISCSSTTGWEEGFLSNSCSAWKDTQLSVHHSCILTLKPRAPLQKQTRVK